MKLTSHKKQAELSIRMTETEALLLYKYIARSCENGVDCLTDFEAVTDFNDTIFSLRMRGAFEPKEEQS